MAKKKAPERVTVEGFTWEQFKPPGKPLPGAPAAAIKDRWTLVAKDQRNLWEFSVKVTDFGEGDDEYRSGWRVVAGAPEKERYETRDEAMRGAVKTIHKEVKGKLGTAHERFKRLHDLAKEVGAI
jgi:hypothetical protein